VTLKLFTRINTINTREEEGAETKKTVAKDKLEETRFIAVVKSVEKIQDLRLMN
jgi:hypothetical protein